MWLKKDVGCGLGVSPPIRGKEGVVSGARLSLALKPKRAWGANKSLPVAYFVFRVGGEGRECPYAPPHQPSPTPKNTGEPPPNLGVEE